MKEEYVKPLIVFESFSLTQTIAKDCGDTHDSTLGQSNHLDANSCQWIVGDPDDPDASIYFFEGACRDAEELGLEDPEEGYDLGALCYNNPDGGQEVFSSY